MSLKSFFGENCNSTKRTIPSIVVKEDVAKPPAIS